MNGPPSPRLPCSVRGKVLVVDDDPVVLQVIQERLEQAGYGVCTRENALGTSQWIAAEKPDLVLLDVRMPALSGGELAQMIRRSSQISSTGVIFCSSLEEEALAQLLTSTGALGAIPKSYDARRFIATFERFASRHKALHMR